MNTFTHSVKQYIEGIGGALLFNTGNDVLKMPTQLVQTLVTDENGQVWILVPKPLQQIEQFHPHFPARLHYYKKGHPVALQVYGKATIVTDPETVSVFKLEHHNAQWDTNTMMLVHVQIQHVEVFDLAPKKAFSKAGIMDWFNSLVQWLFGRKKPAYRHEWAIAGESTELMYLG